MSHATSRPNSLPLRGVIPPLVTPLAGRNQLDLPGLERLIEHVIDGGVNGLFLLGTSGELASLGPRVRRDLIARAARLIRGRIPFVVGVTDTCLDETLALASHAAVAGAAAVVLTVPYYVPPDQDELIAYVRTVAAGQHLPILLYNIPALTKAAFEVETVLRLAEIDKVVGIKDSSGELAYLEEIAGRLPRKDWSLLVGIERLFVPAMRAGLHGCVAGGANVAPRLFAELYAAILNKDQPRIQALESRVNHLGGIYRVGQGIPAVIRGMKTALAHLGICSHRMAEPFRAHGDAEREQVRQILEALDR
ncbi:MAG TPA: dihydrodipicolinate synthase family protein [Tepidisphaeraceae bacterium]